MSPESHCKRLPFAVKGTPERIVRKYEDLALEAEAAGDPVRAQEFWQQAEGWRRR
jgi:hypothetical protein